MAAPDLLTTEVVAHRLHSTAEEMLATLVKSTHSPNIEVSAERVRGSRLPRRTDFRRVDEPPGATLRAEPERDGRGPCATRERSTTPKSTFAARVT